MKSYRRTAASIIRGFPFYTMLGKNMWMQAL
jgi:hypothetical protein